MKGISTDAGRETADATVKRLEGGKPARVVRKRLSLLATSSDGESLWPRMLHKPRTGMRRQQDLGRTGFLGGGGGDLRLARLHISSEEGADTPQKAREWLIKAAEAARTDAALTIVVDGLFRGRYGFD